MARSDQDAHGAVFRGSGGGVGGVVGGGSHIRQCHGRVLVCPPFRRLDRRHRPHLSSRHEAQRTARALTGRQYQRSPLWTLTIAGLSPEQPQ
jgi:hypothetical protein